MAKSQNGWPASPDLKRRDLIVAGVEFVGGIVDNDNVEAVFRYLVTQYANRVEMPKNPGCWGFSFRPNRNDPNSLSNHSSGTAIDVNAPAHPNGITTSRTFTQAQIVEVHKILAELDHVVRWGGDYTHTVDAMHFEINVPPGGLQAIGKRLRAAAKPQPASKPVKKAAKKAAKKPSVGPIASQIWGEAQSMRARNKPGTKLRRAANKIISIVKGTRRPQ
jgi:hypothetical protein